MKTYPVKIQGETHNDRMAVLMSFLNDFPDVCIRSVEDDEDDEIIFFLKERPVLNRFISWLNNISEKYHSIIFYGREKTTIICQHESNVSHKKVKAGQSCRANEVVG